MPDSPPKNKDCAAVLIKAAFQVINEAGGSLRHRDVLRDVEARVRLRGPAVRRSRGHGPAVPERV